VLIPSYPRIFNNIVTWGGGPFPGDRSLGITPALRKDCEKGRGDRQRLKIFGRREAGGRMIEFWEKLPKY